MWAVECQGSIPVTTRSSEGREPMEHPLPQSEHAIHIHYK